MAKKNKIAPISNEEGKMVNNNQGSSQLNEASLPPIDSHIQDKTFETNDNIPIKAKNFEKPDPSASKSKSMFYQNMDILNSKFSIDQDSEINSIQKEIKAGIPNTESMKPFSQIPEEPAVVNEVDKQIFGEKSPDKKDTTGMNKGTPKPTLLKSSSANELLDEDEK